MKHKIKMCFCKANLQTLHAFAVSRKFGNFHFLPKNKTIKKISIHTFCPKLQCRKNLLFFLVMRVLDLDSQYWSGQIQNIESLKRLYSVRWGGNKWPRGPLGGELQWGGFRGHFVKVGLVVLLLKRELDSLMECLRWWWSGWPPLLVTMRVILKDLGNFSPKKEKNLGEQKFACLVEFSW